MSETQTGKLLLLLARPFTHSQVRYFADSDRNAAWEWLRENALSAVSQQSSIEVSYRHVLIAIDFSPAVVSVLKRAWQ